MKATSSLVFAVKWGCNCILTIQKIGSAKFGKLTSFQSDFNKFLTSFSFVKLGWQYNGLRWAHASSWWSDQLLKACGGAHKKVANQIKNSCSNHRCQEGGSGTKSQSSI